MKKIIFTFGILLVVFMGYLMIPVEYEVEDNIWKNEDNYMLESYYDDSIEEIIDSSISYEQDLKEDIDNLEDDVLEEEVLISNDIDEYDNSVTYDYVDSSSLVYDDYIDENNSSLDNDDENYLDDSTIEISFVSYSDSYISVNEGRYIVKSILDENKVFASIDGLKKNGTLINLSNNNYNKSQIWDIKKYDGYYKISSVMNDNVLLNSIDNNIALYKDGDLDTSKWYIRDNLDGSVSFIDYFGSCITSIDNDLKISTCMELDSQKFYLEKYDKDIIYNGIDISLYQGDIDWNKVALSDVDFVIIRAGYGDNWNSQDDYKLFDNILGCEEYNIPYGIYLYSYADKLNGTGSLNVDSVSVTSEVAHILRLLEEIKNRGYKPSLGTSVFYDMEDESLIYLGKEELSSIADNFCSEIESNGYKCGIYANKYWLSTNLNSSYLSEKYNIWLAEWLDISNYEEAIDSVPTYSLTGYSFWQFSSSGSVSGISGLVDLDLGYNIFD